MASKRRLDPLLPNSFKHKYSFVNGIIYHYVDEGPELAPTLVLCHGFPDLWYGWRYQIPFLVDKGYRVIVPDLRGYGETEAPYCPPNDIREYGAKNVCKDLIELLNQIKVQKAIFIGHDWGGHIAWRMAVFHPDRVISVIGQVCIGLWIKKCVFICCPYTPPQEIFLSPEAIAELVPSLAYHVYFAQPKAEIELDSNVELIFKAVYRTHKDLIKLYDGKSLLGPIGEALIEDSPLISKQELNYIISQYKKSGFHGPLNWYKVRRVNFQDEKGARKHITIPCLMNYFIKIVAMNDPNVIPDLFKEMPKYFTSLTMKYIEGSGHWVMLERANKVNELLGEFLDKVKVENGKSNNHDSHDIKAKL
ncbi:10164_t:CDS:2 [Paraglomus brasilianum]|uniref:10164_t:CDS:1 n=1 Tax=Paraglomus brasilianum TaxID=144538 RepID=A0A9N9D9K1_9GLOM|nr:10164_t:CDS:2 [Paraglomus brasilianum]